MVGDDNSTYFEESVNQAGSDEDMFASQDLESKNKAKTPSPECSKSESNHLKKDTKHWRGTPLNKLKRNIFTDQYPPIAVGPKHAVLFKLPVRKGEVPQPWPEKTVDSWDANNVRMPHSPSSLYPVTPTELRRRWKLVEQGLSTSIHTSHQLEAAILHYNSKYSDRWDFKALHTFFSETLEEVETEYFFSKVMPKVIDLALSLPKVLTGAVPLLRQHRTQSISLSQQQISCLLANAFLCTFPRRNTSKKQSEYSTFPDINFNRLFSGDNAPSARANCLQEKLKCLINYFRRVTTKVPDGVVTFSRHHVPANELPRWDQESAQLPNMYVSSEGTIEDQGYGMLQMDFANKFVGGGVLGRGCVQEEIRFVIYPELILARLFTEVLDDMEALIITGCERFSDYRGYADSFEWAGNADDNTPRDSYGRRYCTVVAVDAFHFSNAKTQYLTTNINRELNKAYAGFSWGSSSEVKESIATGNWGCGAFRGDACLKSLLQLMAAAKAGRDLAYFTFGDAELRDKLADMHDFLVKQHVTVGELWRMITSFNPLQSHSLYSHVYRAVHSKSIPPTMKAESPFAPYKKPRYQESANDDRMKKQEMSLKELEISKSKKMNGHRLGTDGIEQALEDAEDEESETDNIKNIEAKTLNVNSDKELCLKRLNSSWSNLNESKRDFSSNEKAASSKQVNDANVTHTQSPSLIRHDLEPNKKKKISDYFQSVSKK